MAILINDVSARIQYTATSGQTVFTVPFEFFENSDLKVYQNNTLLTIATHYTVAGAGVTGGGTVTFVTGATADDTISIVRDVPVKRVTDFPVSGPFNINGLNEDLDRLTAMVQQQETRDSRTFRLADSDTPASLNTIPSKANRAGKVFAFDSDGQPVAENEIGEWKGNWAASTTYAKRDIVKDASNSNVYRANTAHTSSGSTPISSNTDAAKWDLVVDAAAAAASEAAAAASEAAAAASESNAASSASAASSSASAAASSASSASSAQSAAESARDATLAAYDNFDDRYLGPKSSAPTLDNDGNALIAGSLYFDTTTEIMKVYTGSAWVTAYGPAMTAAEIKTSYESNADTNAFTDSDETNLDDLATFITLIDSGAVGDGTTNDASAIESADAAYAGNRAIVFRAGKTYLIDTSITISSSIRVEDGAILKIGAGDTLTLNGPIDASPLSQIFDVATLGGTVAGSFGGQPVSPFWWGVAADGTTSSAANDTLFDAAVTAAADAEVDLNCYNQKIKRYAVKTYTASGLYSWKDYLFEKLTADAADEIIFTFQGSAFDASVDISADVDVNDRTLSGATGASLAAGDLCILCDTRDRNPDAGSNTSNRTEWVTLAGYNSGTGVITLNKGTRGSYLVASDAGIVKTNNTDMRLNLHGKIIGGGPDAFGTGGTDYPQTGIRAIRCHVEDYGLEFDNTYMRGFWCDLCTFEREGWVRAVDVNEDGYGYALTLGGCFDPKVSFVDGKRVRHVFTGGKAGITFTLTTGGGSQAIIARGHGGYVKAVHGQDCLGSVFDTHPSIDELTVGSVTGNLMDGSVESAITIQSNDVSIESICVRNWQQHGVLIQYFGKPSDERRCLYHIGSCELGQGGDSAGDYVLNVTNNATTDPSDFSYNIGSIAGKSGSGIIQQPVSGAGSIRGYIGTCVIESTDGNTVYVYNLSTTGKNFLTIANPDIHCSDPDSTGVYTAYVRADNYYTANTAQGSFLKLGPGTAKRSDSGITSVMFRVIGADIEVDPMTELDYPDTLKSQTNGAVYTMTRA